MASLELVPHPSVLAVQVGVFLANLVVVKKLWVEPYLLVKERRQKLTVGSKDEATRLLAEAEKVAEEINSKLLTAASEAKASREGVREAALQRRTQILAAADAEAKAYVGTVERQVKEELMRERGKVPAVVHKLTDEVYTLALS